ncbi:facilitated trehalose transporter Tret1-like isoform X2 [Galleria mellonella]|nr:facilitated trehalose transporter Tret1-like isoform X2 [Galleria mellonella]XP_031765595.2 facilitated trehalose transporter Tret1-like isoform X2 [Galleria mellonella]
MQKFGRRKTHFGINITIVVGWLTILFANSVTMLFIARLIQGLTLGGVLINCIIASEYCDPKRRGYIVAMKKVAMSVGILTCHTLALYWTWRQISLFAVFPPVIVMINTWYWPESPSYLALKEKIEECQYAFYWLHGKSTEKENELEILIAAQAGRTLKNKRNKCSAVLKLFYVFRDKGFVKSFLLATFLILAVDASGRVYYYTYITEILREIVKDEATAAYCTVVVDLSTTIAQIISVFLIHNLKRRTVLFSTGILSTVLMLAISLTSFLKSLYHFPSYSIWIILFIVMLQSFVSYIGLIPVCYNIVGEIFPLEYKDLAPSVSGISFMTFFFITLKFTPVIIDRTGLHGMYLIYGVCLLLTIFVLYFILPETKDRTLQDIEDDIRGIKRTALEVKPMLEDKLKPCP